MFILNGQTLNLDTPFTANDIQYPANWLRLASPEDRAAIGISEVADPEPYDDRFYWGPNNPKDLNELKTLWVGNMDTTVYNTLVRTDWMDSRKANDPSYVAPEAWVTWRQAIRNYATTAKTNINSSQDVEALISVINTLNWPEAPSN